MLRDRANVAFKLLVKRCIATAESEHALMIASPVFDLLSSPLTSDLSVKAIQRSQAHASRLRLEAASLVLRFAVVKVFEHEVTR